MDRVAFAGVGSLTCTCTCTTLSLNPIQLWPVALQVLTWCSLPTNLSWSPQFKTGHACLLRSGKGALRVSDCMISMIANQATHPGVRHFLPQNSSQRAGRSHRPTSQKEICFYRIAISGFSSLFFTHPSPAAQFDFFFRAESNFPRFSFKMFQALAFSHATDSHFSFRTSLLILTLS